MIHAQRLQDSWLKAALFTGLFLGAVFAAFAAMAQSAELAARATINDAEGTPKGTMYMLNAPQGSLVRIELNDITPGWHAVHFHERGACEGGTDFNSAGGHAARANTSHGAMSGSTQHLGDLPNVFVGDDGIGRAEFFTATTASDLNDADGSAFMVHAGADDYRSQPAGNAGDRIACGVVQFP